MKHVKKILLIGLVALLIARPLMAKGHDPKAEPKEKDLFVIKTSKRFVGAQVQVLYGDGEVVTSQKLKKRKMVIDFSDVKVGSYKIRVAKGDEVQEFTFEKK